MQYCSIRSGADNIRPEKVVQTEDGMSVFVSAVMTNVKAITRTLKVQYVKYSQNMTVALEI